jgi:hypothetical protein
MTGWAKDQGTPGSMLKLLGDPTSEFTKALGLVLDHPGPMSVLGNPRCKRFSMLIDDGVIKSLNVAEGPDDPAGDAAPQISMVDQMLKDLGAGAALQYPIAPPKTLADAWSNFDSKGTSSKTATSAHAAWSPNMKLSPGAAYGLPRPQTLHGGFRSAPRALPQIRSAPRAMAIPRLDEEGPNEVSVIAAGLIGMFVGSGVTLALYRFRRVPFAANKQPLLSA